jgi:hypothetical protein
VDAGGYIRGEILASSESFTWRASEGSECSMHPMLHSRHEPHLKQSYTDLISCSVGVGGAIKPVESAPIVPTARSEVRLTLTVQFELRMLVRCSLRWPIPRVYRP